MPHDLPPGQPFSLLISTWAGDRPDYLRDAFVSSVDAQTRRPDQVVLVQDGPVPEPLAAEIRRLVEASPVPVSHVELPENLGLGPALDAGLRASEHEIVARMDADDVSQPDRFEKQLPLIEAGADIVGSGLWEFGESTGDVVGRRTPPTDPDEIRRVIRFRDPFNHPTVVYRRTAVLAAGGYSDQALMEDYLLFTRMVAAGAVPANLAEPLVNYRVGDGAYARRGGLVLLRSELSLQSRFRALGLTSRRQYLRNVVDPGRLPAGAGRCEKGRVPGPVGQPIGIRPAARLSRADAHAAATSQACWLKPSQERPARTGENFVERRERARPGPRSRDRRIRLLRPHHRRTLRP